jgi:tetratricopeptide (TPR) repeat protein
MVRFAVVGALLLGTALPLTAAEPRDLMARARLLYNQGQFEDAVAAADELGHTADRVDSADLIAARSYLERFRETAASEDLSRARDRLRRLNPNRFSPLERTEFIVGLGQTLFFDGAPGAAAAVFDSVLASPTSLRPDDHERVLDWWASALDRDASPRSDLDRQAVYQSIRVRVAAELEMNPASAAASYWSAAAARGQGDLHGAWDAVQAGWVRAPLAGERSVALRSDLDRLVVDALIPERARTLAQSPDRLRLEWEEFKERWAK